VRAEALSASVWRLPVAVPTMPPYDHTNSYVIASRGVGVIVDPASDKAEALEQLDKVLEQAGVRFLKAILLTHTHPDHTGGIEALQARFGDLPVYAHPLERARLDLPYVLALDEGRTLTVGERALRALHTPGHSPGSLSFQLDDGVVLTGDLVTGAGPSWVGFPEGDVSAYLESLARLEAHSASCIGPGHGPAVHDPPARLRELKAHRLAREAQIVTALQEGAKTLPELLARVYPSVPASLAVFARGSLLAHLHKLMRELRVVHLGESEEGPFVLRR
jgi:ribonuclease/clavin/mitogillin